MASGQIQRDDTDGTGQIPTVLKRQRLERSASMTRLGGTSELMTQVHNA